MIRNTLLTFLAFVLLALCQSVHAQVPEARIDAAIEQFQEELAQGELFDENYQTTPIGIAAANAMLDIPIEILSFEHVERLYRNGLFMGDVQEFAMLKRLRVLMRQEDLEGARAAALHAEIMALERAGWGLQEKYIAKALRAFLEHPGLDAFVKSDQSRLHIMSYPYDMTAGPVRNAMRSAGDESAAFLRAVIDDGGPDLLAQVPAMLVISEFAKIDQINIAVFRADAIDRVQHMLEGELNQRDRALLEYTAEALTDRWMPQELANQPIWPMTVAWSSNEDIDSFADYGGKVLVLNYTGTGDRLPEDGPAFPYLRSVIERYEGHGVAVVNVACVRGAHYLQDRRFVSCHGSREFEFSLMDRYVKEHDVTWDVVFADQLFDPFSSGLMGTPQIAIIDPSGDVRARITEVWNSAPTIQTHVDTLLKEFGKDAPSD